MTNTPIFEILKNRVDFNNGRRKIEIITFLKVLYYLLYEYIIFGTNIDLKLENNFEDFFFPIFGYEKNPMNFNTYCSKIPFVPFFAKSICL